MKTELPNVLRTRRFAEFFAGIGLMRMGLEQAGWEVAFANDIDTDKYEIYSHQFSDALEHFIVKDIHKLAAESIPSVALATASFPCNDLSLAGMRKGLGGRNSSAYWGFIRLIREMGSRKPPIILIENVSGFLTSHEGRDLESALGALNSLEYLVDMFVLDAADFVPQSRVRLFIVGSVAADKMRIQARSPHFYESKIRPRAVAEFIFGHPNIIWNIRDLPSLPMRKQVLKDILEDLQDDSPFWWERKRVEYLVAQMSSRHREQLNKMMDLSYWSYGTVFRRVRNARSMAELRLDGIAGCLRTPRGGSGRQILVKAGFGKVMVRLITPRECANLMGAEGFAIRTTLNKALFGFGDAVCVPAIKWIGENYLNPLAEDLLNQYCGYSKRPRNNAVDIG